jgi:hypothetical protein
MIVFGVGAVVSGWLGAGLLESQQDFDVCMLSFFT